MDRAPRGAALTGARHRSRPREARRRSEVFPARGRGSLGPHDVGLDAARQFAVLCTLELRLQIEMPDSAPASAEPSRTADRFSRGVMIAAALLCALYVAFAFQLQRSTGMKVVPAVLGVLALTSLRLRAATRLSFALVALPIVVVIHGFGAYIAHLQVSPSAAAERAGRAFDTRSKWEVVTALRATGIEAYTAVQPKSVILTLGTVRVGDTDTLPLGGVAGVKTVYCNEGGTYTIYDADERGFSNPKGLWDGARRRSADHRHDRCISGGDRHRVRPLQPHLALQPGRLFAARPDDHRAARRAAHRRTLEEGLGATEEGLASGSASRAGSAPPQQHHFGSAIAPAGGSGFGERPAPQASARAHIMSSRARAVIACPARFGWPSPGTFKAAGSAPTYAGARSK
jgi:hypothetical protein